MKRFLRRNDLQVLLFIRGKNETHSLTEMTMGITQFIVRKTHTKTKQSFCPKNALLLPGLKVPLW